MSDDHSKSNNSGSQPAVPPRAPVKSTARQQRLAAQLRENLKKRKHLSRARKTSKEDDSL
jgi:hypothetical protein